MNTYRSTTAQYMLFSSLLNRWFLTKRAICYVLLVVLPSQAFISCAGGHFLGMGRGNKYAYTYKMTVPVDTPRMIFQDESLKIQFKIDAAFVRFQLQNLSHSVMTVQWEKVSLGVNNAYSLVRHTIDMYADTDLGKRSVQIPPLGYIQELVIPVVNVFFDGSQWVQSDLFQTTDGGRDEMTQRIRKNDGKSIVLILPLQIGASSKDYRFEFRIASVKRIPWKDYRPPKLIPPPPTKKTSVAWTDEITTAIVIVGMLGFVAFMVSLKKQPVSE